MKILVLILLSILPVIYVSAHEGHDKTPGAMNAPHGGLIQGTNFLYWELVSESGGVKLYPLTHDITPISLKELVVTGTVTFPKKTKGEVVKFSTEGDYFFTKVDAKGAYRYTLELSFTYKGKKEKVKFQIEPQN